VGSEPPGGKFTSLDAALYAYVVEHGAREDEVLRRVRVETAELGEISVMQVAPDQGALITLLVRAIGARRALELGTFTGYSAICIARGLASDGRLLTCELSEEWAEIARHYFADAGLEEVIELRLGTALETLRSLPSSERFDFAFIDADKEGYPDYYEHCVARLRPGGVLMVDNVLLGGRVLDPDDASARAIAELNERIAGDGRVDVAVLGIADGVTVALKR
jgi:caffeoyl-CoA O-methyltransferase